jgi:hypothetical protein
MLDNLTTNELISNISYLCELNSAASVLSYETSKSIEDTSAKDLLDVLISYRNELINRIAISDTVMERSTLTQIYYRLLSLCRSLRNYSIYFDDYKNTEVLKSNLESDLKKSSYQLDNIVLSKLQYQDIED